MVHVRADILLALDFSPSIQEKGKRVAKFARRTCVLQYDTLLSFFWFNSAIFFLLLANCLEI